MWTMIVGSCMVSVLGVMLRKPVLLYIGAVLLIPLGLYLGATPRFQVIGFLLPLFQVAAAVAVKRRPLLAAVLLSPILGFVIWLAHAVLTQPYRS
jgi:ABC-type anion transport system duplicated permease subunit